jgi:RAQPRD family integrative conjugative element protein
MTQGIQSMPLLPLLLLSLLLCQDVVADEAVTAEHQALLKVDRHLAELVTLIEAAEQSADPDARIRFRYDWLRRDIAKVRKGVQAHIHRPLAEKLANAELHGDYRR